MSPVNWVLVIVTAATFAVSLPFNKILVGDLSPVSLSLLRALFALPVVVCLAVLLGGGMPRSAREWLPSVVGAVFLLAVPFCAIAFGQQFIPSGLGGILYGTMPLITSLLASLMIKDEHLNQQKLFGCGLGLIGVTAIVGPAALSGINQHLVGVLVTLIAPMSYATGTVLLKRLPASNPLTLTSGMFSAGLLVLLPTTLVFDRLPAPEVVRDNVWPLVGLATLGTAAPAFLNYVLIQRAGAVNASLVMFIMPAFAVAFGVVLFGETLRTEALLGMVLTISGCVLVSKKN